MKNLMKLLLLVAMIFVLASCGKKDEGGSSSSSDTPAVVVAPVTDFYGSTGTEFGDIEVLKNYYLTKSFAEGAEVNQIVYHIGPDYGMPTSGGGSFNLSGCLYLFGIEIGDCGSMGNTTILEGIVTNGEYKVIDSSSVGGVSYREATSVVDGEFVFEPRNFDQNSEAFRQMLNLDNKQVIKAVVSKAKIVLKDGSEIAADLVEYFYGSYNVTGIDRFILSKDLPLLANPVANFNAYGNPTGALNNIGNKMIRSISAMAHSIQVNPYSGESTITNAGPIGITLSN